ncbi:MAG: NAD-dependent methanol dehydrogenase [Verrucomicrobia subdivision 3 bacterium]|nr:NAD-dependent methanol dehydrogenase [Limisphaerales bacterium]MCS1413622.1 NAD-dependent methanol dehydrogenase [Limisphaerales bacterium]
MSFSDPNKSVAASLAGFESPASLRLVFGNGTVDRAGQLIRELGGTKALLVTDLGIVAAGHASRVAQALEGEGIAFSLFDQVRENPTTRDVNDCVAVAQREQVDFLIGLGGGSSMDTAKGCNFILTNGGAMKDYWGGGKATQPMLPLIAIPTTAGTGSECQSFALIADEATHQKMACGDVKVAAKVAILDPELTLSQPRRVTACTGVDAITHAIESAVTKKRTPISKIYSREAFRLLVDAFPKVLANEDDLESRGAMLLGAAMAGVAIENSMLGAAHSAANPLTAHFDMIHGQAVGMMLPHVIAFNAAEPEVQAIYAELAAIGNLTEPYSDKETAVESLVDCLQRILNDAEMLLDLETLDVNASKIATLADEAAKQWTAGFNPRAIEATDFEQLYFAALQPASQAVSV